MTAASPVRAPWTRPLPAPSQEQSNPHTLPMPVIAAAKVELPAPVVLTRMPRKYPEGLVLTGHTHRAGVRFAWLLDATDTPLGPTATESVLADLQELLRGQLATLEVLTAMKAAHRYLSAGTTSREIPVSAALLREKSGVVEVAVMGSVSARMIGAGAPSRTVVCPRPRRSVLETVGVRVDITTDAQAGRPAEVEVGRTDRAPRADVPVLGGTVPEMGHPGYGVAAAHLLESVELRAGRGLRHAVTGALSPLWHRGPRR